MEQAVIAIKPDGVQRGFLYNFNSLLTVVLLVICTCTYLKMRFPALLERGPGFHGFFWRAARIGECLSPWVASGCLTMGFSAILFAEAWLVVRRLIPLVIVSPLVFGPAWIFRRDVEGYLRRVIGGHMRRVARRGRYLYDDVED